MPRTTEEDVQAICEVEEDVDLTPYIEMANELVTEVCEPVLRDGLPFHSEARLTKIETLIAAHFYRCLWDQATTQEGVGSLQTSFEGKVDLRLQVTKYCQQAMVMDTSGALAALNNSLGSAMTDLPGAGRRIRVTWLGKT